MKSSFVWILALSASAAFSAHVPSSYEDWVNEFKPCGQSCLETLYAKIVGDTCGSNAEESTSPSKTQCICRAMTSKSVQGFNAGRTAGYCYVDKCGLSNKELSPYLTKVNELRTLCSQLGYSGNSGTGRMIGASSSGSIIIPTSNPIDASHTFGAVQPTVTSSGQVVSDGASSSWGRVPLTFGSLTALGALFACN